MQSTQENRDQVQVNSILHISPAFNEEAARQLGIVVAKHSWGCDMRVGGSKGQVMAVSWQFLEHTGGIAVWGEDDALVREIAAAPAHHA